MATPSKDRDELIREHGERLATLTERIDNLRRDIDRIYQLLEVQSKRRSSWSIALLGLVAAIIGGLMPELVRLVLAKWPR